MCARSGQRWASQDCGPRAQVPWATHGCGLLSAGCPAALMGESAETIILILAAHLLPAQSRHRSWPAAPGVPPASF